MASLRLAHARPGRRHRPHRAHRSVQRAGTAQLHAPTDFRAIVARYVALTTRPAGRAPDVIIWPEGAIPGRPANDFLAPGSLDREPAIAGALKPGQSLLVGALPRRRDRRQAPLYYNTLVVALREGAGRPGAPPGSTDKYRLVPFGEYMPMDVLMGRLGIKQAGPCRRRLLARSPARGRSIREGLPAQSQPLICYEALFPGLARGTDRVQPIAPPGSSTSQTTPGSAGTYRAAAAPQPGQLPRHRSPGCRSFGRPPPESRR